jgi:esterase/lipase
MTKNIILFFILFTGFSALAQTKKPTTKPKAPVKTKGSNYKMGYVYEDLVLDNYKAVKNLDANINAKRDSMQAVYNDMAIKYQTEYLSYQNMLKNLDSVTTEILNAKLKAVQESKSRAEEYMRESEKVTQSIMGAGINLIRLKIDEAIKKVAAEKQFPTVLRRNKNAKLFDQGHIVLYAGDAGKDDLTAAVIAFLNAELK